MKCSIWKQRWFFILFCLLLFVGLLAPLPIKGRIGGSLSDSLHTPAFAVLALLFFRTLDDLTRLRGWRLGGITCLVLITLGAMTEVAQYWVGRNFSIKDIVANGFGVVAGTLWAIAMEDPKSRRTLKATAAGLVLLGMMPAMFNLTDAIIQYREFPVVASFEQPLEKYRWQRWWCTTHRSSQHATDGQQSLQIDIQPGPYPGIGTSKLVADWSGYKELVFDIDLDEGAPIDWHVKIMDRHSRLTPEDSYERRFHLKPGRQQIVVPLADVKTGPEGRPLDLYRIHFLQLFTLDLKAPRTIFVDNLRLR